MEELAFTCPYCGEETVVEVAIEERSSQRIEDCTVCCRPIDLLIQQNSVGELSVVAKADEAQAF